MDYYYSDSDETELDELINWIDSCQTGPYRRDSQFPKEVIEEVEGNGYKIHEEHDKTTGQYLYHVYSH